MGLWALIERWAEGYPTDVRIEARRMGDDDNPIVSSATIHQLPAKQLPNIVAALMDMGMLVTVQRLHDRDHPR